MDEPIKWRQTVIKHHEWHLVLAENAMGGTNANIIFMEKLTSVRYLLRKLFSNYVKNLTS